MLFWKHAANAEQVAKEWLFLEVDMDTFENSSVWNDQLVSVKEVPEQLYLPI